MFGRKYKIIELPSVSSAVSEKMHDFRQGDWLKDLTRIPIVSDGKFSYIEAKNGVVVISQTCDLVLKNRLTVQVVPLETLSPEIASLARAGKMPQYVHLPELGDLEFANLEVVATFPKAGIAFFDRTPGVDPNLIGGAFGKLVGRRFSRFPFPDVLAKWFEPLKKHVSSKSLNSNSPECEFFGRVAQLRIESRNGWDSSHPLEINLIVILEVGTLPMLAEDTLPEINATLSETLYKGNGELKLTSSQIAKKLKASTDPAESHWLWHALAEAWANICHPEDSSPLEVKRAISGGRVSFELLETVEFTLDRYFKTEMLDLDHLSEPTIS